MKDIFQQGNTNLGQFGQFGLRVLTSNAISTEKFSCIQVVEDAVISATLLPYNAEIGDSSITSLSLTAGMVIYGRFTALQVASGKVIAYKG